MKSDAEEVFINYSLSGVNFCTCKKSDPWKESKHKHYGLWRATLKMLRRIGWRIYVPSEYSNGGYYSILRSGRRNGKRSFCGYTLEFKTEIYPRGFRFEFFQNHNFENQNGGQYDFGKYKKMPYLLKKAFTLTTTKIAHHINSLWPVDISIDDPSRLNSHHRILTHFRGRSFTRTNISSLDDIPQYMSEYDFRHNSTDADGKQIKCGDLKYYYGYNGYLEKGIAYHNINNMWWVIPNESSYSNVSSSDLFDITPERLSVRRKARHNPPKEYLERVDAISKSSTKELKNELKRRMKKAA